MGTSGRLGLSLFTYPRNIVTRMVDDVLTIKNGTPAMKLQAAKNIQLFVAPSLSADYLYKKITCKDRAAYNQLTVLTYIPGGWDARIFK